jgi:hypothetical protein
LILFDGNVKITVPSTPALAVYVNVNVLLVSVHPTVALLNVTSQFAVIVISLDASADVTIHTQSIHVKVILPDSHDLIY